MNAHFLALATLAAPAPIQSASERPWTFLVYGAADNNADGPILEFLDAVRAALDDDPGIELVLFLDRHEKHSSDAASLGADFTGARIYRLHKTSAELVDPGQDFPELTGEGEHEVDSADPKMLGRFVAFGKKRFPAKRYGLLIYSHADGRGMCPDEKSDREMRIPELTAEVGADASVDFLGLELCNMAGIEVAYQWRPENGGFSADVLVAIPNAGPPLDWDRAFARIRSPGHATQAPEPHLDPSRMSAADLGRLVIEEGHRGRQAAAARSPEMAEHARYESASCCDLAAAADVKKAVDALAVALARSDAKQVFEDLRGPSPAGKTIDYARGNLDYAPYFDLHDLCIRAAGCEKLSKEARDAAQSAATAVDGFVLASFGMDGLEGFEQGKDGVFIVFPDGDEAAKGLLPGPKKKSLWSRFRWYSPLPAKEERDPYGRWAFLADGATADNEVVENWFELLDCWFDPDPEMTGGVNGYRW